MPWCPLLMIPVNGCALAVRRKSGHAHTRMTFWAFVHKEAVLSTLLMLLLLPSLKSYLEQIDYIYVHMYVHAPVLFLTWSSTVCTQCTCMPHHSSA